MSSLCLLNKAQLVLISESLELEKVDNNIVQDTGDESLPFSLKIVMLALVLVALILVVFSASVGAICRIQCKVFLKL